MSAGGCNSGGDLVLTTSPSDQMGDPHVDRVPSNGISRTLSGAPLRSRLGSMFSEEVPSDKKGECQMKSTFVDANAMKEKVRQKLSKPKYLVSDFYTTTGIWQAIARSTIFEYLTLAVIGFNALWIAVDTDFNNSEILIRAHPVFIVAENFFCAYFSFELFCRFMAFRCKKKCLNDSWFVFDALMVIMMIMETWIMAVVMLFFVDDGGASGGDASLLRVARLLRLSRMARMARLLRALPELMIMIRGMIAATRSVFFTLCLLWICLYVFAIAFTQLTANTPIGNKHFQTVPESMFSLLLYGTLLDNIGLLAGDLERESIVIGALFFIFVLLAAFTVMNMLIGVLCEVVNAVAATEKEEMLVSYVNEKLQRVVKLLDTDGNNSISKKEFLEILENMDAVRCLQDVGVDVIGLVDFADFIFETDVDVDEEDDAGEGVTLDFAKFMEVVLALRGTNNATVKDIVDLRKFIRSSFLETRRQLSRVLEHVESTRKTVSGTHNAGRVYDFVVGPPLNPHDSLGIQKAEGAKPEASVGLRGAGTCAIPASSTSTAQVPDYYQKLQMDDALESGICQPHSSSDATTGMASLSDPTGLEEENLVREVFPAVRPIIVEAALRGRWQPIAVADAGTLLLRMVEARDVAKVLPQHVDVPDAPPPNDGACALPLGFASSSHPYDANFRLAAAPSTFADESGRLNNANSRSAPHVQSTDLLARHGGLVSGTEPQDTTGLGAWARANAL